MGKYEVKFSCGHTETVKLFGKMAEREGKTAWYAEKGICPKCYNERENAKNVAEFDEVCMNYRDYKNNYEGYKTKRNSYDAKTKTIIVFIPKKGSKAEAIEEIVKICSGMDAEAARKKAAAMLEMDYTEEQIAELKARADSLRESGNQMAQEAARIYSEGLTQI